MSPYSLEEVISREYILNEKPDLVINIVDGTNLERNLYLTLQLIELGTPLLVALNMMDEAEARGDKFNLNLLSKQYGVPFIGISATKNRGIDELMQQAVALAETAAVGQAAPRLKIYDESIENAIASIVEHLGRIRENKPLNLRWTALRLLEGDEKVAADLQIPTELQAETLTWQQKIEKEYDNDIETVIADNRYRYIGRTTAKAVSKAAEGRLTTSDKIDMVVTNRIVAIPLFLLVMYIVFAITFGVVGSSTIDLIDVLINETIGGFISGLLQSAHVAAWLQSLVVDGIIAGLGSFMVFVPQIMILFFFISLLEDSGYMARVAFVMDRLLRKLGLSGKSFIPMIIGFGCSVPAVMAARTLENEKDRRLTIILTPFMSCGARLPVYALFTAAFFSQNQGLVIFSIYLLGIAVAILSGILFKQTIFKGEPAPFVMELPPYRFPTPKGILIHMWDRGKRFMIKAGTIIFIATVLIWLTQTFSFDLQMVEDPAQSMLGLIGGLIAPVFAPLGFDDWQSSVALLTGFIAKEAVVATLGILHGLGEVGEDSAALIVSLQTTFTPLKAYAFMAFTVLYLPCMAAFATIKREMNSWKWTLFAVAYQTTAAWIIALMIFQVGRLCGLN